MVQCSDLSYFLTPIFRKWLKEVVLIEYHCTGILTYLELKFTGEMALLSLNLCLIYLFIFSGTRPQNLIAQSQSGTGKTAAFSLAMLSHVNPANKWTQVSNNCRLQASLCNCSLVGLEMFFLTKTVWFFQCLCVSPTYELALQIGQVIEQMGKFCPDVKLSCAIRGNTGKNDEEQPQMESAAEWHWLPFEL